MKRLALLLLLTPRLFAAVSTSALTGRVTSDGKPIANATITATSTALQAERVTTTGASGKYWLGALPPGEYEVTFAHKGMQTVTRRAVVQLARVARADAQLEVSEDEESVTSTATTISAVHDTALTTTRNAKALDQLPVPVNEAAAIYLAPIPDVFFPLVEVDGTVSPFSSDFIQSETVEALTFIRDVTPVEFLRNANDSAIVARTRSGGEELSVSVRDTITTGVRHFVESTAGGHIVPNRLWFFGAGWDGEGREKGYELKLTGQLDARQNLAAMYIDGTSSLAHVEHVAQWDPQLLTELSASRVLHENAFVAKASWVAGDHVVSGGVEKDSGQFDGRSAFINDRIWLQRWVINAGVHYLDRNAPYGYNPGSPFSSKDNGLSVQVAAAYDLRGRGRNALTMSATRYFASIFDIDEFTLGYIMALGSTGSARLNVIRDEYGSRFSRTAFQIDSAYRLFDRFEAGLNYTHTDSDLGFSSPNAGNAWFSAEIPVDDQAFGFMVAYRYSSSPFAFQNEHAVDVALRYTLPIKRVMLTMAADGLNVFDQRTVRGWVRLRL